MDQNKITNIYKEIIKKTSEKLRRSLMLVPNEVISQAQEIRYRINKPVIINCSMGMYFIRKDGIPTQLISDDILISTKEDIFETFKNMCCYSIYSYQNEIKNGYITIKGGHRVGICGTAVFNNKEITNIKDISSLNIRIAREVPNIAKNLIRDLDKGNIGALIVGPPSCGKTTVLRDIARLLSNGELGFMKRVCVVDERGEIAGVFSGECQNDLGFCDIFNGYPKGEGIMQAIRSMSPEVIVFDEVSTDSDIKSIKEGLNAGVCIISSIHAGSIEDLINRKQFSDLINTGAFKKIVMHENREKPGYIKKIYEVGEISDEINRIINSDFHRSLSRISNVTKTKYAG